MYKGEKNPRADTTQVLHARVVNAQENLAFKFLADAGKAFLCGDAHKANHHPATIFMAILRNAGQRISATLLEAFVAPEKIFSTQWLG